jgi:NAD-dependent SIR2 family protein deacetylase
MAGYHRGESMVETVSSIVNRIQPERTVLMFGAGSSVPSRAPTSQSLIDFFASRFQLPQGDFTLREITSLAEHKVGRNTMIAALREQFRALKPTGGLLNLSLYNWKSLYTTNYDDLIEQCYRRRELSINVFSSDFDFGSQQNPLAQKLFKLHGTIDKGCCRWPSITNHFD